ncbi:MAG: hypothetical protein AB7P02_12725 [Alphaproteobacteria bacterium]
MTDKQNAEGATLQDHYKTCVPAINRAAVAAQIAIAKELATAPELIAPDGTIKGFDMALASAGVVGVLAGASHAASEANHRGAPPEVQANVRECMGIVYAAALRSSLAHAQSPEAVYSTAGELRTDPVAWEREVRARAEAAMAIDAAGPIAGSA